MHCSKGPDSYTLSFIGRIHVDYKPKPKQRSLATKSPLPLPVHYSPRSLRHLSTPSKSPKKKDPSSGRKWGLVQSGTHPVPLVHADTFPYTRPSSFWLRSSAAAVRKNKRSKSTNSTNNRSTFAEVAVTVWGMYSARPMRRMRETARQPSDWDWKDHAMRGRKSRKVGKSRKQRKGYVIYYTGIDSESKCSLVISTSYSPDKRRDAPLTP